MAFKALTFLLSVRDDQCPNQDSDSIENHIKDLLKRKLLVSQCFEAPMEGGLFTVLQATNHPLASNITIFIRGYTANKIHTINIEAALHGNIPVNNARKNLNRTVDEIRQELTNLLGGEVEKIPPIKRASSVFNYYASSDDRLLEYDFTEVLFDEKSKYQRVKILKSNTLGNALFLDDLQNLAEKDLPYTHGLMNYGNVSYKDRDILILGGGDGGLLYELLKEEPKFVTMIDIDGVVVEGCKKYLRGACGSVLDTLKTDKYEIIISDCLPYLEEYSKGGRKFDVVFNDLTDIPLVDDDTATRDIWALIKRILPLSFSCLPPHGKYMNHAIGSGCIDALETYDDILRSLPYKLEFSRHTTYVPSFLEEWVFYDITKLN